VMVGHELAAVNKFYGLFVAEFCRCLIVGMDGRE
jgi:hypothetical protein